MNEKEQIENGAPKADAIWRAGPFLGVDFGLARTGLALSDPAGSMAFPLGTVKMTTRKEYFAALLGVIERENPIALVVGLPLRDDGSESLSTRQVRNFVKSLQRRVELPVALMPEYLSSYEAECQMRESGAGKKTIRDKLDQQAAVRILQSFLEQPGRRKAP